MDKSAGEKTTGHRKWEQAVGGGDVPGTQRNRRTGKCRQRRQTAGVWQGASDPGGQDLYIIDRVGNVVGGPGCGT